MSATNLTKNLKLSQFVASDKPSWLGDVNGDNKKIDDGYGVLAGEISKANDTASSAKSQSDANTQTLTNVNSELEDYGNRITALESGGGTEQLEQRVNTLDSDVEALQTRADTFEEDITQNGTNITNLTKRVTDVEGKVKTNTDNITSVQAQTSGFAENIQNLTSGQADINSRLSVTSATATNALSNSSQNSTRITSLSNRIDSLDIDILTITPTIEGDTRSNGAIISTTVNVIKSGNQLHFCSPIIVEVPIQGGWASFKEVASFISPIGSPNPSLIGQGFYTQNKILRRGQQTPAENGRFYITFSENKYHIYAEPTETGISYNVVAIFCIPSITLQE